MAKAKPKSAARGAPRALTAEEKRDWLCLIRSENVGPATFHDLLAYFGSAKAALKALPELSLRGGRSGPVRLYSETEVEREMERANALDMRLIALGEAEYPPWLAKIYAPPPLLYLKGITGLTSRPIVAIVGARIGSAIGQKLTRLLANDLGLAGYVIASGFARGIDTAAHQAALPTGTIAVVAGGIDVIYPSENDDLHRAICERGLFLSERPPGLQPRAQDFPRRNRLISGLAAGVVVMEAARRSGSLTTARFAGEQGREVFAVPGHPLDPLAAGTNRLLKDGACLVETADDVISGLAPMLGRLKERTRGMAEPPLQSDTTPGRQATPDLEDQERRRVIAGLSYSPIDIDELIRGTGLSARAVHVTLLELDLNGRLQRHGQQMVSLRKPDA